MENIIHIDSDIKITDKKISPYLSNFCGPIPLSFAISSRVLGLCNNI